VSILTRYGALLYGGGAPPTDLEVADGDHLHDADNIALASDGPSDRWRIYVDAFNGSTSYGQISEIQLRISVSGADQCSGGTPSASSERNASYAADKAFDDSQYNMWNTSFGQVTNQWVEYQFASVKDIVEYTLQSNTSGFSTWMAKDFHLQYYNGTSWVTVDTRTDETGWGQYETRTYTVGVYDLAVAEADHLHTADNVVVTTPTLLEVAAADHLHVTDNIALTQVHNLSVAASDHLNVADNIALTQNHSLAVAAADHLHTADELTIVTFIGLTISEPVHLHTADSVTLTQHHILTVLECYHVHAPPNLALILPLSVQESAHLHDADSLALSQQHELSDLSADHLHVSDPISLTQAHTLQVAAADHPSWSSVVAVTQRHALAVGDSNHLHLADALSLSIYLTGLDAYHDLASPQLNVYSAFELLVAEAAHDLASDALSLALTPSVQPADHLHFVDLIDLTGTHNLAVDDSAHYHEGEKPDIYMVGDLPLQSAVQQTASDNIDLGGSHYLAVADSAHATTADEALTITQGHRLDMDAGYGHSHHIHSADNIEFAALPDVEGVPVMASLTIQRSFWPSSTVYTIERSVA